jgi:hypothetical protein
MHLKKKKSKKSRQQLLYENDFLATPIAELPIGVCRVYSFFLVFCLSSVCALRFGSADLTSRGKLLDAHQVNLGSQVKENTIVFDSRPNYVSCNILRFDIVRAVHINSIDSSSIASLVYCFSAFNTSFYY